MCPSLPGEWALYIRRHLAGVMGASDVVPLLGPCSPLASPYHAVLYGLCLHQSLPPDRAP